MIFFDAKQFQDLVFILNFYSCMLSQDVMPLSQLTQQAKLRYLKELSSNKHLHEAALVFTACSKLHKLCILFSRATRRTFPQFPTPQTTYSESNYSKIILPFGNTTSNQISFRVTQFSNIFPDNAVEGGKQLRATEWGWEVNLNKFNAVSTDLETPAQYTLKTIRCPFKIGC